MIYAVLYSPSSVQKVMDFIKSIFVFQDITPVIVNPIGAAAQIGIPEAYRYTYRKGKILIVLPEISDLSTTLKISKIYYIDQNGEEVSLNVFKNEKEYAIIFNSGDNEPSKKELMYTYIVKPSEIPVDLPASSLATLLFYLIQH